MKRILAATVVLVVAAAPVLAQPTTASAPVWASALVNLPAKGGATLTVTTPAWQNGGDIPFENTAYRGDTFPGLNWTAGTAGTASYAVIMQDTGGAMPHMMLYNVPATVTRLDAGMTATSNPPGSSYLQPYVGPRTPPGPKHTYRLEVFALDTTIPANPAFTFGALTAAMKDHVLASGEITGLGSVDPTAPPPRPRPAPAGN